MYEHPRLTKTILWVFVAIAIVLVFATVFNIAQAGAVLGPSDARPIVQP